MNDTTEPEFSSHDWMSFVDAVRYVAKAVVHKFNDDPIDHTARGLEELREALIEDKIPVRWAEDSYGRGFNIYMLYGLDHQQSDLEWTICYIAGDVGILDPRPSYMDMNYIADLTTLRQLRLQKARVMELWPNGSTTQSDVPEPVANAQMIEPRLSEDELKALVREELRRIYKTSQPHKGVAERLVRKLTGATRSIIRPILNEPEFRYLPRPRGNNRGIKPR